MDAAVFRKIMGQFATGVSIVTTRGTDGSPHGLTVNALASVSLEPLLLLFCLGKTSSTAEHFLRSQAFAVNIMASHQKDLCIRFATQDIDRFSGIRYEKKATGAPILPDVLGYMECRKTRIVEAGDHYMMLGEVLDGACGNGHPPLLFFSGQFLSTTNPAASLPEKRYVVRPKQ